MGMPSVLKNFNVYNEGKSWMGEVAEVVLPKLSRKTEGFRGGGMDGEAEIDLGQEKMELEMTCGGIMRQVFEQYGIVKAGGVGMRFAGAYQSDDTAAVQQVEVVVRGRHKEIDPGKAKAGDKSEFKVKSNLVYYKLTIDGKVLIEIDVLNFIFIVNGVDMLAEQRKAIGM
jgi:P2 family phage contractile tail tube protein